MTNRIFGYLSRYSRSISCNVCKNATAALFFNLFDELLTRFDAHRRTCLSLIYLPNH